MLSTSKQETKPAGIYSDLAVLLRSRFWAKNLKLFSRQAARGMLLGETRSRFRGRGMEFEEVRLYQAGDDIRSIDWRVSARTGSTYTKLFCEEHERPVHIIVDQRSSLFFGSQTQFKSVLAAELATGIAWAALAGSDRIGGQVIGDYQESDIRAKRNKQAVLRFIHDLNTLNHALPTNSQPDDITHIEPKTMTASLQECRRITRPGTAIFIISDFHDFDETSTKQLVNLGKHADISLIHVVDPLEENLPVAGAVSISDGEQRTALQLGSSIVESYQQQLIEQREELERAAVRARAHYTKTTTARTARQCLSELFGK